MEEKEIFSKLISRGQRYSDTEDTKTVKTNSKKKLQANIDAKILNRILANQIQ